VFGSEMTAATATCVYCGATGPVAQTVVYLDAPGTVVRCRNCARVLMVFARVHDRYCVDLRGLATLETR
jgi:ribosomal protein S27E